MMSGRIGWEVFCMSAALLAQPVSSALAECRSATESPAWPEVARAISTAKLCEQLPMGPNRTASLRIISADVCSNGDGIASLRATAQLTCETGDDALFEMPPVEGKVLATISLDVNACRINDTHLEIDGDLGGLLSQLPDTQEYGRQWAQSQLSRLCRLR